MNKDFEEDKVDDIPVDWQALVVKQVQTEWDKGYQYVERLNDLYDDMYAMLRGERPEKNYDWQSNIVINKVFQVVWTTVPYIVQKIFGANPVMGVKGPSRTEKGAKQRQEILEFYNTFNPGTGNHTPYYITTVMWALRATLNGVGILKKTWHQSLKVKSKTVESNVPMQVDEGGDITASEPHKTIKRETVPVEDWPANVVVNNKDIVSDWALKPGQSIRQGRFVIHREITDYDALVNSKINYINLDDINVNANSTDSQLNRDHETARAKDGQETPPESDVYTDIEVYERVGLYPIYNEKVDGEWVACFDKEAIKAGDAKFKFMIVTVNLADNVLIRFEKSPYEEINYLDLHLYLDPERWQSTGQVEPIKDLQTAMSDNINAMFDEIWQNLMSPAVVNKYALWDWDTMQYAPGQRWLVGGNPNDAIKWKEGSNITQDAWQKHSLFDHEVQLTSAVTNSVGGMAKEKAATTNIMNSQMSAGKLDFLVKMVEVTGLIPDAQMNVRFAKKFAHKKTMEKILGEAFQYGDFGEEMYRYIPAAASVKLEHQKAAEIQEDLQLMQVLGNVQNPNTPKVMNKLLANIFRNRNMDDAAELFDEDYFEPSGDAGNVQMLNKIMGSPASNEKGIKMSPQEKGVRQSSYMAPGR
jgi:hypothetical protein